MTSYSDPKEISLMISGSYPKITFWTDPPTKITGEINYKLSKNCLLSTKVYRLLYNRIIKKNYIGCTYRSFFYFVLDVQVLQYPSLVI